MSESMYDDVTLEECIIRLREQVNDLSKGVLPFSDPVSDYTMTFYDHPDFIAFAEAMEDGKTEYKIPE